MRVVRPDMELWLTGYLRSLYPQARVTNKEPSTLSLPLDKPLIVVRDDGGPVLDHVTFDCSVGVSILWGSKTHDMPANDLAREVAADLFDKTIGWAGGPIVSVVESGCNGPIPVAENLDVARRYITAQYVIVGDY